MIHLNFYALTPVVRRIMIACGVVFFLQLLLLPLGLEERFIKFLGLGVEGIRHGWVWQLISYAFLHGGVLHLLLNMLGLFFLGPELERYLGPKMFFVMFLFCSVLGGLGWLGLTWPYEGVCIGASGGIFGLIGAFAGLFPHRQLTLLVFFVLPVTMPAWLMAVLFGFIQLAYLLNPGAAGIAYSAHLAGGLAGYLFVKVIYRKRRRLFRVVHDTGRAAVDPDVPTREEVDLILDKISRDGLHTLTMRERMMLQRMGRK
jgi:membrane associated rhomboid family serine protease